MNTKVNPEEQLEYGTALSVRGDNNNPLVFEFWGEGCATAAESKYAGLPDKGSWHVFQSISRTKR